MPITYSITLASVLQAKLTCHDVTNLACTARLAQVRAELAGSRLKHGGGCRRLEGVELEGR